LEKTIGRVMKGPPSPGQQVRTGNSSRREAFAADDLLTGGGGDHFGEEVGHVREFGQHFELVDQALRHPHFEHFGDPGGDFADIIDAEGDLHPAFGGEGVDQQRDRGAFGLLEQQGGAALFDGAVGELGDFEAGIHLEGNAFEFARAFQGFDEVTKILMSHSGQVPPYIYYDEV
jgi:hypothetical protein